MQKFLSKLVNVFANISLAISVHCSECALKRKDVNLTGWRFLAAVRFWYFDHTSNVQKKQWPVVLVVFHICHDDSARVILRKSDCESLCKQWEYYPALLNMNLKYKILSIKINWLIDFRRRKIWSATRSQIKSWKRTLILFVNFYCNIWRKEVLFHKGSFGLRC